MYTKKILVGVINFILAPTFMFVSTPLIDSIFDTELLAIWFVYMALSSMGYVLNFGISDASLQFISNRNANHKSIWQKIFINILVIIVIGAIIYWVIPYYFKSNLIDNFIIKLIFIKLIVEQLDLQIGAFLKVNDKFSENLICDIYTKLGTYIFGILLIYKTEQMFLFFMLALILTFLKTCYKYSYLYRKYAVEEIRDEKLMSIDHKHFLLSACGFFVMAFSGFTVAFLERLILPGILDLKTISHITIATQIAFFLHSLPAAGMSFVLPMASKKSIDFPLVLFAISFSLSFIIYIGVAMFTEYGLQEWLPNEATEIKYYALSLVKPFFIYSLCVVPYYLVMATNRGIQLSVILFLISIAFIMKLVWSLNTSLTADDLIDLKILYLYTSGACIYVYFIVSKTFAKRDKETIT